MKTRFPLAGSGAERSAPWASKACPYLHTRIGSRAPLHLGESCSASLCRRSHRAIRPASVLIAQQIFNILVAVARKPLFFWLSDRAGAGRRRPAREETAMYLLAAPKDHPIQT